MDSIKNYVLVSLGIVGAFIAEAFGGWDLSVQTLVIFITVDFTLGLLIAAVWGKSSKTETGKIDSRACWQGLIRKGGIFLVVLIAARLDLVMQTDGFVRTAVIMYFIGNEGISIVENLGTMGVPLPNWLRHRFEALKNDSKNK